MWPQISVQTMQLPSRVTVNSFALQAFGTMIWAEERSNMMQVMCKQRNEEINKI